MSQLYPMHLTRLEADGRGARVAPQSVCIGKTVPVIADLRQGAQGQFGACTG